MPNKSGRAYALTALCPLLQSEGQSESRTVIVRDFLNDLVADEASPMARVPNTYMCRFAVLSDVFYEGNPAGLVTSSQTISCLCARFTAPSRRT